MKKDDLKHKRCRYAEMKAEDESNDVKGQIFGTDMIL